MVLSRGLVVAAVASALSAAHAGTLFVDDDNCPGPGSGTKADPYCSIQTAIDNAVDTDEITVAPGTYFETIDFLGKAVWLHSSAGADVTIIDGTGNYHVVWCASDEGPGTVLDGFTITGGNADGIFFPDAVGGGMYIYQSSPTVINCTFSGNTAIGFGGGMHNQWDSNPTVTNCTFSGNSADVDGGGMHNWRSSPIVTDCTFSSNVAARDGGGMANRSDCSPTVTNCRFSGNTAVGDGGGMYNGYQSDTTVIACTFIGNSASDDGGGLYNYYIFDTTVIDCVFSGNTALGDGGGMCSVTGGSPTVVACTFIANCSDHLGGGMYNEQVTATVCSCIFSNNSAVLGGGMSSSFSSPTVIDCAFLDNTAFNAGGVHNESSDATVTNCLFSGNSATNAAGMHNQFETSATVTNCTFTGNAATNSSGGMLNDLHTNVAVTNCSFSRNTAGSIGGGMRNTGGNTAVDNCILWDNDPDQIHGSATVAYSDVEGGFPGTGNVDAEPMFVDAAGGNYRLTPISPCVDAGDNAAVPDGIHRDLDGKPRFIDATRLGVAPIVDMGAYELQIPWAWDLESSFPELVF